MLGRELIIDKKKRKKKKEEEKFSFKSTKLKGNIPMTQ